MAVRIVLAGEGGQGVQAIANILAEAADAEGKEAIYIPNFGVEQRGGVSIAYVQVDEKTIGSPKFPKADIVIALSPRSVERTARYVDERTTFVYDSSLIATEKTDDPDVEVVDLPQNAGNIIGIPANDIAKVELHPRVFNVMILGAVIKATGVVTEERIKQAVQDKFGSKFEENPELKDLNFRALEKGMSLVERVV